ncbi:MAG: sulfur transferase domain-containing protein, partial [Hyphomonadaceae bacterium]|nr:sulfur transferase domain-containing protein [Hyphomonadaceae bacterium]
IAQTPVHFPQKLDTPGFQGMIADTGPAYVSGQPTEAALRDLAAKGVKTIINLRTQPEMDNRKQVPFDEAAVAKELGINYVHVPLGGPDTPYTPEAVEKVAAAMKAADGKVLLHCTVAWRASHMWAAYLVKEKGMSYEDAVKAGEAMNLNGYKPPGATSTPVEDLLGRTPAKAG